MLTEIRSHISNGHNTGKSSPSGRQATFRRQAGDYRAKPGKFCKFAISFPAYLEKTLESAALSGAEVISP